MTRFNAGGADAGAIGSTCSLTAVSITGVSTLSVSDSQLIMPVVAPQNDAINCNGANVLLDRTVVSGGVPFEAGACNLEVYSSYFYSRGNGAIRLTGGQVYAVADTFDGQGAPSAPSTYGLQCLGNLTVPIVMMSSCILSGGGGLTSHPVFDDSNNGASCFVAANYDHDYFYFSGPGGRTAGDQIGLVTTSSNGYVDSATKSIMGEGVGCYGVNVVQPSGALSPGSPCIGRGVLGQEKNATPITVDITGKGRSDGGAPDIGAYAL